MARLLFFAALLSPLGDALPAYLEINETAPSQKVTVCGGLRCLCATGDALRHRYPGVVRFCEWLAGF